MLKLHDRANHAMRDRVIAQIAISRLTYTPRNGAEGHALSVKYTPYQDAGHYETITVTRISAISPLPKMIGTKRKAPTTSKSQIITSSPYKKELERKKSLCKEREKKKSVKKDVKLKAKQNLNKRFKKGQADHCVGRGKGKKRNVSEDEDDPFCIVCTERFTASKSREKWITCVACRQWAHLECTPNDGCPYVCHH